MSVWGSREERIDVYDGILSECVPGCPKGHPPRTPIPSRTDAEIAAIWAEIATEKQVMALWREGKSRQQIEEKTGPISGEMWNRVVDYFTREAARLAYYETIRNKVGLT